MMLEPPLCTTVRAPVVFFLPYSDLFVSPVVMVADFDSGISFAVYNIGGDRASVCAQHFFVTVMASHMKFKPPKKIKAISFEMALVDFERQVIDHRFCVIYMTYLMISVYILCNKEKENYKKSAQPLERAAQKIALWPGGAFS